MKNTPKNLDAEYENQRHIIKQRKREQIPEKARNQKDIKEILGDYDAEDLDYDPDEYARYIK